jgi:signal transduction histidine kinase
LKFTFEGSIRISASVDVQAISELDVGNVNLFESDRVDKILAYLNFEVKDTGIGIDESS